MNSPSEIDLCDGKFFSSGITKRRINGDGLRGGFYVNAPDVSFKFRWKRRRFPFWQYVESILRMTSFSKIQIGSWNSGNQGRMIEKKINNWGGTLILFLSSAPPPPHPPFTNPAELLITENSSFTSNNVLAPNCVNWSNYSSFNTFKMVSLKHACTYKYIL